jgi:PmbA protein
MTHGQKESNGNQVALAMEFLQNAAQQSGADGFDIVGRQSSSLSLNVFQGKVQQTEISESVGIGIRIFQNGSPGYASTERLTNESLQQTLKDALSHCAFTEPLKVVLPKPSPLVESPSQWNAYLEMLTLGEMADFSLALEAATYALSSEIENIPHLGYGISKDRSWFANSSGIAYHERENSYGIGIGAVALRNDVRKMGTYQKSGRMHRDADVATMAQIAVARSLELLDARPIAGCDLPVVFSNRVSGSIIGMFLSNLHAESVQKGQSRFAGQLGQVVASPLFTLVSDPFRWDLPGATVLDSEGVPTQRIELISAGRLMTFLHNLETAGREGCTSTGNGSRGYSGRVGTSFHNCIVPAGADSEMDLLRLFPRCLHIVKLEGASGCSAISGEISIGVQGFLYENGVCVQAVDGVTISINFFDMLKQIIAVSSDYNDTFSSIKVPAFAVDRVSVSG